MARSSTSRSLFGQILAALMVLALAPTAGAGPKDSRGGSNAAPGKPITAMTLNVYLGADIDRPVGAALAAQSPQAGLVALANATEVTRNIVDATDFTVRARLLARDIAAATPDLVGLQEVALWRSGPLQLGRLGIPNAETVDYDFLELLLAELDAAGAHYSPAVIGNRADVESPSFTGSPFDGTIGGSMRDVRLTMRDVILVRDTGSIRVTDSHDQVYDHNLAISALGLTFKFDRGYQWVDVRTGGTSFRFINTHLESVSSDLALAQAQQMVREGTAPERSTIIACDCNSDPLNSRVKPTDRVAHKVPYEFITRTFTDQWLQWAPAAEGFTSGTMGELINRDSVRWTHRIDMIFGRTATGAPLGVDRGMVTGRDVADRDPATGLWPSDHAGVVLRLRGL